MELDDNKKYIVNQEVDVTNIKRRLAEINDDVWSLDTSRQSYGALGLGPYSKTQNIYMYYCGGEPRVNKEKALELKAHYKDEIIPKKHMMEAFPNIYLNINDFYLDIVKKEKRTVDPELEKYTDALIKELEQQYNGQAGLVIYEKLPAGANVDLHADKTYYLSKAHRLHIPICTNDLVEFTIEETVFNMKVATLYEINNQLKYGAKNTSTEDVIHLIVDIIPQQEFENL